MGYDLQNPRLTLDVCEYEIVEADLAAQEHLHVDLVGVQRAEENLKIRQFLNCFVQIHFCFLNYTTLVLLRGPFEVRTMFFPFLYR